MFKRPKIQPVIVVEGKTDQQKLGSLVDAEFILTNGSQISQQTLALIKEVQQTRGVILFLDPDYQGERIRKIITNYLQAPVYHCFIKKTDMKSAHPKKIGIAEADNEVLLECLQKYCLPFNSFDTQQLSWADYLELELNSKDKRLWLCDQLHISYANHKQLYKRLVMMDLTFQQIRDLLLKRKG
ncbi:ribonuclease M5 [Ureaplasma miroungigenitalium]|uniref:Ribonuclease M5 n=1 Tax=Ureaplasma miroungigenitalium TaxID=1042321 RepID=A0ABT3BN68_9BACT|nr:ribonuclease M5 [Ureaplasma miroungigenitalium]MCV3728650.1 ribonuclease M5 [Ureaplasma miroungigenitalium]MCV3734341.1 ribonuclease M5 [Ureaplasma miroungigenitalium]